MCSDDSKLPDSAAEMPRAPEETSKVIRTEDLFDGSREICIEHEGERYRLRITRRGKLILQK